MLKCDADGVPHIVQSWEAGYVHYGMYIVGRLPPPDYVTITLFTGDECRVYITDMRDWIGEGVPLHKAEYLELAIQDLCKVFFKDMVAASRKYKAACREYELQWTKGLHKLGTFRPELPILHISKDRKRRYGRTNK